MHCSRGTVFSTWSVPRCYKQDKLGVAGSELEDCWGSAVGSYCCQKLVAEAGDSSGKPDEGERPPLQAATKQRLVKTVTD
jgi:hypothetical protein